MRNTETWVNTFREGTIRNYFPPRIANDLLEFTDEPRLKPGSYFIYGEIATGKTILASKLMLAELKNAYLNETMVKAKFVSFPQFLMEVRNTYTPKSETSENIIVNQYLECDVLVIDDFMTTRPTDWVIDTVYYLINYRYEYLKTTIITSNKDLYELEKMLGDQRITSRINRMCTNIEKEPF
jgi:DNA replication protein DnaC